MASPRPDIWLAPGSASSAAHAYAPTTKELAVAPMLAPGLDPLLLAIDAPLVAPETPFEIIDGVLVETMGSHEPHATANGRLAFVLGASVRPGFTFAVDLLTRADRYSEVAPDATVFPLERDTETGGRQLDQLVFEVRDTQLLSKVTRKAELLAARGVRRIFCLEVLEGRVLEWQAGGWTTLAADAVIDDEAALVRPLPVVALLDAAAADDAAAASLLAKGNDVLRTAVDAGRAAGERDGRAAGERDGRTAGERDGRTAGERDGRTAALREAIVDLCEAYDVPLAPSHHAALAGLALEGLEALRRTLKATRRWPA